MFAAFSPGSDIKRYYRGRMPRLALVVIMLMPLLYGAMYLWAFWNPFAAADKIPVALVNEDTGAVVEGQKLDAGSQVAAGLIESKQLDLHEVSAAEAADGVAHGKYYFSITLPADFSRRSPRPRATGRVRRRWSSPTTTPTTTWRRSSARTPRSRSSTRSARRSAPRRSRSFSTTSGISPPS